MKTMSYGRMETQLLSHRNGIYPDQHLQNETASREYGFQTEAFMPEKLDKLRHLLKTGWIFLTEIPLIKAYKDFTYCSAKGCLTDCLLPVVHPDSIHDIYIETISMIGKQMEIADYETFHNAPP